MLRISDPAPLDNTLPHYLCIDKKKRQITLTDPATIHANQSKTTTSNNGSTETTTTGATATATNSTTENTTTTTQDRGPMVAAPKIFAFDNLFTNEDVQTDVSSSALSEVIPAVLEGTDGCLLTLGYPAAGNQSLFKRKISLIICNLLLKDSELYFKN